MKAATYTRVSTAEQPNGIAVQREAITAEARRRGWSITAEFEDKATAASMARPGITAALEALRRGEADVLVVAKLDRLSRSLSDFAELMARAQREGWSVVALDADVDTSTPAGEALISILSVFAQFERRLISQRTKDTLALKRAQGVRLGRPPVLAEEVVDRIAAERGRHVPFRRIAAGLERDGVPTAQGGRWHASTVRKVAARRERAHLRPPKALREPTRPSGRPSFSAP
jgi:DNA invertase Pin-like site-specific DNA recombinase